MTGTGGGTVTAISAGSNIICTPNPIIGSGTITAAFNQQVMPGNYTAVAGDSGTALAFTAAATLTLPTSTTLTSEFYLWVFADGGLLTVALAAGGDIINGAVAGASVFIPKKCWALITTDAAGHYLVWLSVAPEGPAAFPVTPTNGQLLIGNTTNNGYDLATLTAGSGVTITNGPGTITIAASGGGGVTSISAGSNIALSPNPITGTGTVATSYAQQVKNANTTVAATDSGTTLVCNTALTLTLPKTSTLTNKFWLYVQVEGGVVTLVIDGTDQINNQGLGNGDAVPNGSFYLTTDAGGNWYITFPHPLFHETVKTANYGISTRDSGIALIFAVGGLTAALPQTSTLTVHNTFILFAQGGNLSVTVNALDAINGGAAGVGATLAKGTWAIFSTDANGNWHMMPAGMAVGSSTSTATEYTGTSTASQVTVFDYSNNNGANGSLSVRNSGTAALNVVLALTDMYGATASGSISLAANSKTGWPLNSNMLASGFSISLFPPYKEIKITVADQAPGTHTTYDFWLATN
jgi:hypothetical protein